MSYKTGFTLVEIMIVVVIIGMLASLAVPSFKKVRDQAVESALLNNLRQVAGAGQRYLLEHGTSVSYSQLVADRYFADIAPVAGENYGTLVVSDSGGQLVLSYQGTEGPKNITFNY